MKLFGIYVVRNEADVLEVSIRHHLAHGVDQILVVDNGSTDGTTEMLDRLAHEGRVHWTSDDGPFHSGEMYTELAREAAARGADWVVPIGADEFWHAESGNLKRALKRVNRTIVEATVVTFVQRRGQLSPSPAALLTMTRRVPVTVGPDLRTEALMTSGLVAYVELEPFPRVLFRASEGVSLSTGAHQVVGQETGTDATTAIRCLHAPLRSRSALQSKAEKGKRIEQAGYAPGASWHLRHWAGMGEEQLVDEEWEANSYDEDNGSLSVAGVRVATIDDPTLANLATPWIGRG